ncbi:MAG: Unknown protein [uncultured Thiotrichaceae bacterium]|uniref:Phasin domain-containing protein n=1 Tax=uncultured Thiotrichaceae bacterium TaxID=298394 RepID=A0A6S6SC69_9GAMM|nr:MAG: Unknown protein [uncultured Thiotrichaceae bacterium]
MQNEMMDLMKTFNENSMTTAQRMAELNIKTFEALGAKQSELFKSCFESAQKSAETFANTKDVKELVELQKTTVSECNGKWLSNVREAVETLNGVREEMAGIYEEARTYASDSAEKASELSQKAVEENMEKVTELASKATKAA